MEKLIQHCQSLPQVNLEAGSTLLTEGDRTGKMYVLAEGEVEIRKQDFVIARVSDPGSVLGEISALLNIPHMATVVATRESRFYRIDDHAAFLGSNSAACYPIAVLLAQRLHSVTNYLTDIKEQFRDKADHFGMVDEILETLVNQQINESRPGSDRVSPDDYPY